MFAYSKEEEVLSIHKVCIHQELHSLHQKPPCYECFPIHISDWAFADSIFHLPLVLLSKFLLNFQLLIFTKEILSPFVPFHSLAFISLLIQSQDKYQQSWHFVNSLAHLQFHSKRFTNASGFQVGFVLRGHINSQ